jgi:predicted RNase H-like HicB family nuclease
MTIAPVLPSISQNSLNLPILVGHQPNHIWVARLLGWSECYAEGTTREAAIAALETKLTHQLTDMEVVNLQVPLPQNPNLAFAGIFVDDPDADEVIAAIAAYREELDAAAERDSGIA